jgi:hypothetical protein
MENIKTFENIKEQSSLKDAFVIVWCVLGCVILAMFLTLLMVPAPVLGTYIPPCTAKLKGGTCPACGLTTAFYHISKGEYRQAQHANRYSIALYVTFLVNEATLAGFVVYKILRRFHKCRY